MRHWITNTLFALVIAVFCAGGAVSEQRKDIVDTAGSAGSFETLIAAVQAAGLVDTLKGEGPFTVFAPTDEAFAALPEGTVEDLLKPENKDALTAILTYHVVPGKVMSTDLQRDMMASTVTGQVGVIDLDNGATLNEANLISSDIETSNGVIHVVDAVILPTSSGVPVGPDICDEFSWLQQCGGSGDKPDGDSEDQG